MATRNEMINTLKKNRPEMCKFQKIATLKTDSSEINDCGASGENTVHGLYVQYGYAADTWDTYTLSEKLATRNTSARVEKSAKEKGFILVPDASGKKKIENNWYYMTFSNGDSIIKVNVSSGGVANINGSPFSPSGKTNDNQEAIDETLIKIVNSCK